MPPAATTTQFDTSVILFTVDGPFISSFPAGTPILSNPLLPDELNSTGIFITVESSIPTASFPAATQTAPNPNLFPILPSINATMPTAPVVGPSPSMSTVTTTISTPSQTPTNNSKANLAPGTKAAIAVPIILLAIALLILGFFLVRRRQRQQQQQFGGSDSNGNVRRMADMEPYVQGPHEWEDEARRRQREGDMVEPKLVQPEGEEDYQGGDKGEVGEGGKDDPKFEKGELNGTIM